MRLVVLITLPAILLSGCKGPLGLPMVERLSDEQQQHVDEAWQNMLTPVDRLDRTLLLDSLLMNQFHHYGVDRLCMTSEKNVADGRVVMAVRYERSSPNLDEFELTYVDGEGNELRRERYTHEEVLRRFNYLWLGPVCAQRSDGDASSEGIRWRRAAYDDRMKEIRAATQPSVQE
jgi:predicted small lipoprotein YifL